MVQKAILCDAEAIAALAFQMWDTHSVAELTAEFQSLICKEDSAVFLCKRNRRFFGRTEGEVVICNSTFVIPK